MVKANSGGDLPTIWKDISNLWVTQKINSSGDHHALPENFFPKTLDVSTYVQIQKKIEGGNSKFPAADEFHVAKCFQSEKDKKNDCNANALIILYASIGGGFSANNHLGEHSSRDDQGGQNSRAKMMERQPMVTVQVPETLRCPKVENLTKGVLGRRNALGNRDACWGIAWGQLEMTSLLGDNCTEIIMRKFS